MYKNPAFGVVDLETAVVSSRSTFLPVVFHYYNTTCILTTD